MILLKPDPTGKYTKMLLDAEDAEQQQLAHQVRIEKYNNYWANKVYQEEDEDEEDEDFIYPERARRDSDMSNYTGETETLLQGIISLAKAFAMTLLVLIIVGYMLSH